MNPRPIQARIGIPMRSSLLYVFVDEAITAKHPWWRMLFDLLMAEAASATTWRSDPEDGGRYAELSPDARLRAQIVSMIRDAPPEVRRQSRGVDRAAKLCAPPGAEDLPLTLLFVEAPR